MQITRKELIDLIKSSGVPVFRDIVPTGQKYPYIRYQYVNEQSKKASNGVVKHLPLYQISLFTNGTEKDMYKITDILDKHKIAHNQIESIPGSENDTQVTHYYTYVRCLR